MVVSKNCFGVWNAYLFIGRVLSFIAVRSQSRRERLQARCSEARLPTLGAEVVPRLARLRRAAKLPAGKTWDALDLTRFSAKLQQKLEELATGNFADRVTNVLAFGLPGTGKTHAMAALADRLIEQIRLVLFVPTFKLVQGLLAAKRDLGLPRALRKLDHFDELTLGDLGDLEQRAEDAKVLFTLIAERLR